MQSSPELGGEKPHGASDASPPFRRPLDQRGSFLFVRHHFDAFPDGDEAHKVEARAPSLVAHVSELSTTDRPYNGTMSLRSRQEPEDRLRPGEAQVVLQIHAERESGGPDRPRIEDLAESLGIPVEEARELLGEARRRVSSEAPSTRGRKEKALARRIVYSTLALGVLGLCGAAALVSQRSSVPLQVSPAVAKVAPQPISPTPPALVPSPVPDGYSLEVELGASTFGMEGNPTRPSADDRNLSETDAASLRERFVDAVLVMLKDAPRDDVALSDARSMTVRLRPAGGRSVSLTVPIAPFTLPLEGNEAGRESLRRNLEGVFEAGWPSIVQAMPR